MSDVKIRGLIRVPGGESRGLGGDEAEGSGPGLCLDRDGRRKY